MPRLLAALEDLPEGCSIPFAFQRDGLTIAAFIARTGGGVVAYENLCRHIPIPLDNGAAAFFSADGKHFRCQTHGALYEPATGLCVRGPCAGASLRSVRVQLRERKIWLLEEEDSET